jgi:predicted RNA-binding Zn ribbon-like protein
MTFFLTGTESTVPEGPAAADRPAIVQMAHARTARRRGGQASADEFPFGSGSMCLDFVATAGGRAGQAADLLLSPDRLGDWLREPGLPVPAGGLTDDDLGAARELRAAVASLARAVISGSPGSAADVRCINSFARQPTPVFLLRPGGREGILVAEADLTPALSVIARDAIYMLTGPDTSRLRECARDGCATLFFDRSPSGRRRWCSMKGCGEIVASASYRRRRAGESR